MKDPKALFPLLFATSWLGNLLLTVLAFYLAFTQQGPLTPLVFLTVAVCILAGNLLPISVYLILVYWRQAELKAESREAAVLLRDALDRSEDVMDRLDEAEGSLSKAILVARQVPERIREGLGSLEELAARLDTMELVNFAEALGSQAQRIDDLVKELAGDREGARELQAGLKEVRRELKDLPASVEKLVGQLADSVRKPDDDVDSTVGERLDLLFEAFESVQDSLESLLHRVVELKIAATPPPFPMGQDTPAEGNGETATEPEPEPQTEASQEAGAEAVDGAPDEELDDPDWDVEFPDESDGGEEDFTDPEVGASVEEDIDGEPEDEPEAVVIEEPEETPAEPETPPEKTARKRGGKAAPAHQPEMILDTGETADTEPAAGDGKTRLVAHAMIGMYNKLFIRGDEPWLSWDEGKQMELIGIGEFSWVVEDLREPIDVSVLLNDDQPSEEGNIRLMPGQTLRISPRFQK